MAQQSRPAADSSRIVVADDHPSFATRSQQPSTSSQTSRLWQKPQTAWKPWSSVVDSNQSWS